MDLIASIPVFGPILSTAIPFIVVLGIVVFIHEYGHYIVGRWCGIHAEVFSVGYGKPIWSWYDKRGTKWQIAWLPLGGYVKFLGDANAASFGDQDAADRVAPEDRGRAFPTASVGARAATVAAGPIFNFILSAVIFAGLAMWIGSASDPWRIGKLDTKALQDSDLAVGDRIVSVNGAEVGSLREVAVEVKKMETAGDVRLVVDRNGELLDMIVPYLYPPYILDTRPLSPASKAGFKPGDLILELDGEAITSFDELKDIVLKSESKALSALFLRDGKEQKTNVTPEILVVETPDGKFEKEVLIGVMGRLAISEMRERMGAFDAAKSGVQRVYFTIVSSINGIYHLITGGLGLENLNGPVGIAMVAGEQAAKTLADYLAFVAVISTAIGFLNLLPIPILDGGHLVIFAYEAVVGRQPHEKVLNMAMSVGFVLLMALMVFATYNDIMRI